MTSKISSPWFIAGAAQVDVTPQRSQFLFGYPHVERYSTGVHDPLLASALLIGDGRETALFVGCDIILIPPAMARRAADRIAHATDVPAGHIMITATHTHSGPITTRMLSNEADTTIPSPDPAYLDRLESGIVQAAVQAWHGRRQAAISFAVADGSKLGTNRRDPAGPSIPQVPVLTARDIVSGALIGVMAVVSMHPTVLHEDWTQVSGDFPGLARQWLQTHALGTECPFVYHMGASGNQSPRHVVKANTIEEARRLGEELGGAIAGALERAEPVEPVRVRVERAALELPVRRFSDDATATAEAKLRQAMARLDQLRRDNAPRAQVRTAECDWFGAEETLTLARAAETGRVDEAAAACLPAPVQTIAIGNRVFIGWPGEVFVEFALQVMRQHPEASIITLAGGDLQGYLVTQQAVEEGGYEASNAIFASPDGGDRLVEATLALLSRLQSEESHPCPAC